MTATYIHTKKSAGFTGLLLKFLAVVYFAAIAASIFYIWSFAQDRYATSAAFKISRQDGSSVSSGLVQLALPGMTDSGSEDSQISIGFITSTDLLMDLEKQFNLIEHYSAPKSDFVFRMNPKWPLEKRLDFYRARIYAHFDKDTGLTAVAVDTFDPKLSHDIAESLLSKAEDFINKLDQQIADKQLAFIRSEVDRTDQRVVELNRELVAFQNEHRFINPDEIITSSLAAVQELQMEHLRLEATLTSTLRDSPDSPQIDPMRSRLRSLQELIDQQNAKLSGPERDRMNELLIRFKDLQGKIEFATRIRAGAVTMLENNRVEAAKRSRFFSVIQKPYVPEDVSEPQRWYATISIIVLGLLVFLIFRALTHSVFEAS